MIITLAGDTVVTNEWQFRRKDGSTFTGEVVGRRLYDGRLLGVLRDITDRKQAEYELQELNANLERLVEERTADAANLAAQLRKLASELTLAEQRERQR